MRLSGGDLQRNTYLLRFSRPQVGIGPTDKVYHLGARSRDYLQKTHGSYRPHKVAHLSFSTLSHDLALTRMCVSAHRFCQLHPEVTLAELRLSHDLARQAPPVPVTTKGKTTHTRVIPDALLKFERLRNGAPERFCILLELDRNTHGGRALAEHVRRRLLLVVSEVYRDWFGVEGVTIAYATTGGEGRVAALRSVAMAVLAELEKAGTIQKQEEWAALFRFTAIEYDTLYTAPLLSALVWHRPGEREPVPLLRP